MLIEDLLKAELGSSSVYILDIDKAQNQDVPQARFNILESVGVKEGEGYVCPKEMSHLQVGWTCSS